MKRKVCVIILVTTISILSCNNYSTTEELKSKFYLNRQKFNLLTDNLNKDEKFNILFQRIPDTSFSDLKRLYPKQYALMKELGIVRLSSHYNNCRICPRFYLIETDWPSKHPIFLIYNENHFGIDSTESLKGFYRKDIYNNEFWGLGDKWKMLSFVDTIRNIT